MAPLNDVDRIEMANYDGDTVNYPIMLELSEVPEPRYRPRKVGEPEDTYEYEYKGQYHFNCWLLANRVAARQFT